MKLDSTKIICVLILVLLLFILGNQISMKNEITNLRTVMVVAIAHGNYDDLLNGMAKSDTVTSAEQRVANFIMDNIK